MSVPPQGKVFGKNTARPKGGAEIFPETREGLTLTAEGTLITFANKLIMPARAES
jgi:hypothetical protein